MADVIGYEERSPATMDKVRTGYPRFRQHPFVTAAARKLFFDSHLATRALFPVASAAAAQRVAAIANAPADTYGIVETDGWALLHLTPDEPALAAKIGKIVQHIGVALTSRQAEDWLSENGKTQNTATAAAATASAAVAAALAPFLSPVPLSDILLCRSGMNALYAALEAARALQRPRGKTLWLQLGWLYTDTTEILRKCLPADEGFGFVANVLDKTAIEKFFTDNPGRVAAIIAETPTNPLLRTPDLPWLRRLADRHGALLLLDPSISGLANVNALPFADILVTSITKYASHKGDVMAGALAVNPGSPAAATLLATARQTHTPAYWRDMTRLAEELPTMPAAVAQMNANAIRLAAFLRQHPAVRQVRTPLDPDVATNYAAIARAPNAPGGLITIELNIPLARFYDRIRCVKGPSFGVDFTIASPYIYMAHYDLTATPDGRRELLQSGIDPELIRISTGIEPYDQLEATFAEALA
jgi:cystathionine gamma-synthase